MAIPEKKAGGSTPGPLAQGNSPTPAPAPTPAGGGEVKRPVFSLRSLLPGGSGADQVAKTEQERLRKQKQRAEKKAREVPPVLPPPMATSGQPSPGAGNPAPAVAGGQGGNGLAQVPAVPGQAGPSFVQWAGPDLAPVTDAAVPLFEEILHNAKLLKLRKAKIDDKLIKEIEKDLAWPKETKAMLAKTSASLGAKYLNQIGISATYRDEVNFGMAVLVILRVEASVNSRLDKLIAAAEQKSAPLNSAPAVPAAAIPTMPPNAPPTIMARPASPFPTEMQLHDETQKTSKK